MTALMPFGEYLEANIDAGNIDFSMRAKINEEGEVEFYIHPASTSGDTQDYIVGISGKAATHVENLEFIKRLLHAVENENDLSPC